jgi:hypothetical protein
MIYMKLITILTGFFLISGTALAGLSDSDRLLEQHAEKLDKINYLPALLPLILDNRDVIELTDSQFDTLLAWRNNNRVDVIEVMNEIMRKRVEIKQAALSPEVSALTLKKMQSYVFNLQRAVMEYKLSCRDLVINTFNRNNWDGFYFVLAEQGMDVPLPELYMAQQ